MGKFKSIEELEAWLDEHVGESHEYTVIVYQSTGDAVAFPLWAANQADAFRQFDAMYMQLQNTRQVYPYATEGSELNRVLPDADRVELLDYFTEDVLAEYSIVAVR